MKKNKMVKIFLYTLLIVVDIALLVIGVYYSPFVEEKSLVCFIGKLDTVIVSATCFGLFICILSYLLARLIISHSNNDNDDNDNYHNANEDDDPIIDTNTAAITAITTSMSN